MAQQTTARLKEWFSTNEHPTQQQFHDWLDSYRHRSETIALNDVEGLAMDLQGKGDMGFILMAGLRMLSRLITTN